MLIDVIFFLFAPAIYLSQETMLLRKIYFRQGERRENQWYLFVMVCEYAGDQVSSANLNERRLAHLTGIS